MNQAQDTINGLKESNHELVKSREQLRHQVISLTKQRDAILVTTKETLKKMVAHVNQICADWQATLERIDVLTPDERKEIIEKINKNKISLLNQTKISARPE